MKSRDASRAAQARRRATTVVRTWAPRVLGAVLLGWAFVVLYRQLSHLSGPEVAAHMRAWGPWRIVAASGLSVASFSLVALVEWLGLRWSGAPLPWRTAALRSFMINGLIHSLGANVVTAALTRAWVYRRVGVRLFASAAVTAFTTVTLFLGLAVLVAGALLTSSSEQLQAIRLSVGPARIGGGLLLAMVAAYLAACVAWPSARLFDDLRLPRPSYAAAQVVIGAVDNLVSSALLWLLVGRPAPPYGAFAVAYVLAYLAGLLSTVPGGVGVFEAGLVLLLPQTSRASLAAGFMGFRLIFYLAPLIAALLLVLAELLRRPRRNDAG